jgi:hypothetical protein
MFQKTSRLLEQVRHLSAQLETERVESARMRRKLDAIQGLLRTNGRIIRRLERAVGEASFEVARTEAVRRLEKLAASGRDVIVGPWYGEIGFEVICWAPFVRWALAHHGFDLRRVGIVSRGGARDLYGVDVPYVDLYDVVAPEELRALKRSQQKQETVRLLDRRLLRDATRRFGMRRPRLFHPVVMYAAMAGFWRNRVAPEQVVTVLDARRVTPPRLPDLPATYAAVRFYASRALPDTPRNRAVAAAVVQRLAAQTPVVILRSQRRFDDHGDLRLPPAANVTVVEVGADPAANVSVQMSVMAHAQSFVGTYGGGSYLAAAAGVPVLALWSEPSWRLHHLALAQLLFRQTNGGRFSVVSCDELALALGCSLPAREVGDTPDPPWYGLLTGP